MLPRAIPKQPKRASRWKSQALDTNALRGLLRYADGKLYWLARERDMFPDLRSFKTWNARFAGQQAFTASHSEGYRTGRVFGRNYFAHRIIWEMHFGDCSGHEIDHVNGNRADNRLENLRLVTRGENRKNIKRQTNNKSGAVGVYRRGTRWGASIQQDKRLHSLGTFDTFDQAAAARKQAEARLNFHHNHGRD